MTAHKTDCLAADGSHKHACDLVGNTVCGSMHVPSFYDLMAMAGHCSALYGVLAVAVELSPFRRLLPRSQFAMEYSEYFTRVTAFPVRLHERQLNSTLSYICF